MNRIDIHYGGFRYSVDGRHLDDLMREVVVGMSAGAHWLEVTESVGPEHPAYLLLTPGVPLSIVPAADLEFEDALVVS